MIGKYPPEAMRPRFVVAAVYPGTRIWLCAARDPEGEVRWWRRRDDACFDRALIRELTKAEARALFNAEREKDPSFHLIRQVAP